MSHSREPLSQHTFLASDARLARRVARPLQKFLAVEAASGILLLAATVVALVWVNSPAGSSYDDLWNTTVTAEIEHVVAFESHHGDHGGHDSHGSHAESGGHAADDHHDEHAAETAAANQGTDGIARAQSVAEFGDAEEAASGLTLKSVVADVLMSLFFFVVGLEIKREFAVGQLNSLRAASLPIVAALGGMIVPAAIYFAFTSGTPASNGWGIPMATDIAFALGLVALLGSRVPPAFKVLLLAVAVVDDIGAIIVIAVFYSAGISWGWLALGGAMIALVLGMQRLRVWHTPVYVAAGIVLWVAAFQSGVHATIAGVILGLLAPARPLLADAPALPDGSSALSVDEMRRTTFHVRESVSVVDRLTASLHPVASFVIVPLFALASTGIELSSTALSDAATSPVTMGVAAGLVFGKAIGIFAFTSIAIRAGVCCLPPGLNFRHVGALGFIAGIGFTVSLFVTELAFTDLDTQAAAKIGILGASIVAGVLGLSLLASACRGDAPNQKEPAYV